MFLTAVQSWLALLLSTNKAWSSATLWFVMTAKCIDQYVKLRVANADGNDEPVPMDSRLEGVVEKMFDRCVKDHQYKQVLRVCFIRSEYSSQ